MNLMPEYLSFPDYGEPLYIAEPICSLNREAMGGVFALRDDVAEAAGR